MSDIGGGDQDIHSLKEIDGLETLEFESCKKSIDLEVIGRCKRLHTLKINKCGEFESLKFVKNLSNLRFFTFVGTNLASGDLTDLLGHPALKYVGFIDSKKYNLTFDNLNAKF